MITRLLADTLSLRPVIPQSYNKSATAEAVNDGQRPSSEIPALQDNSSQGILESGQSWCNAEQINLLPFTTPDFSRLAEIEDSERYEAERSESGSDSESDSVDKSHEVESMSSRHRSRHEQLSRRVKPAAREARVLRFITREMFNAGLPKPISLEEALDFIRQLPESPNANSPSNNGFILNGSSSVLFKPAPRRKSDQYERTVNGGTKLRREKEDCRLPQPNAGDQSASEAAANVKVAPKSLKSELAKVASPVKSSSAALTALHERIDRKTEDDLVAQIKKEGSNVFTNLTQRLFTLYNGQGS